MKTVLKRQDPYAQTEGYLTLARIYFDARDYGSAEKALDRVFALAPHHSAARVLKAKIDLVILGAHVCGPPSFQLAADNARLIPGRPLGITARFLVPPPRSYASNIVVRVWSTISEDEEFLTIERFQSAAHPYAGKLPFFAGKLPTALAPASRNDGVLQVVGQDRVRYAPPPGLAEMYRKGNWAWERLIVASEAELYASSGEIPSREDCEIATLESAIAAKLGFNSPQPYWTEIRPGGNINVRVIDADRSTSAARDVVHIHAVTSSGDRIHDFALVETGTHSGVFEGSIPTRLALAGARATDSQEGSDPTYAISPGSRVPWIARPDARKPKTFTVVLSNEVVLAHMRITANEPGRKLKRFTLECSRNAVTFRTIGKWPGPQEKHPARIEAGEAGSTFAIALNQDIHVLAFRLIIHNFETDGPAINSISLISSDGDQILPTKADLLALRHNKTLEMVPGDRIRVSYRDPLGVTGKRASHERRLSVSPLRPARKRK